MTYRRFVLTLLALVLLPLQARAAGFIIPELGARKNGMGAAIGRPDDLSAIYHNPAALVGLRGTQLAISFGAVYLTTNVRLAQWPGSDQFLDDPVDSEGYYPEQSPGVFAPMPMIAASTNLWSDKLVGAFGIYVPNAAGADFGADAPSRYHIIDAYVVSAFFTGAVAYRPLSWLSAGLGVSAVYVRIKRRNLFYPVIDGTDYSWMLGKQTELDLEGSDVQPAFTLGVQLQPLKSLSFGLMVLSRYDVALEGPLTLKPGPDAPAAVKADDFKNNRHRTTVIAPWIFGVGANWDITPWLEVGAEFRYYLNRQVDDQVTTLTNTDGPLPTLLTQVQGAAEIITPKNLHDSFHTGGGVLVKPPVGFDLDVMTGFHYETSSAPNNTVDVSQPSFDLASVHLGGRWRINDRFRVTLAYAHYWYFQRKTTDSITTPPTNFVGSGSSNMVTLVLEGRIAPGIGVE